MSTPLVGITPIFAVCFWGYDIGQRIAKSLGGIQIFLFPNSFFAATDANGKLNMAGIMFAGGFSAIPTTASNFLKFRCHDFSHDSRRTNQSHPSNSRNYRRRRFGVYYILVIC